MNNLVIAPDQQSGTYNGRRVVAVAMKSASRQCWCSQCAVHGNCHEDCVLPDNYCWQYAAPAPSDTVCKRCGGGGMVGDYLDVRSCPDCDMAFKVNLQRERLRYANGGLDTAPSDTAMLDWVLENCKVCRCEKNEVVDWKHIATRADILREMGRGK